MNNKKLFRANSEDFNKIPGSPISYWVSNKIRDSFNHKYLYDFSGKCRFFLYIGISFPCLL